MTSAELIAELQAARPAADGSLRERVRSIAAVEPTQRRSPFAGLSRFRLRRVVLVAVPATCAVLLGVAGVAGLTEGGPGESVAVSREDATASPPAAATSTLAPQLKAGADATTPAPTTGRAQRYSAELTLSVDDVDALSDATQRALVITHDLGGYLVTASYATSTSGVSSLTVKVPTARVQEAIVRLSGLGTIVGQQIRIDDLQGQVDELTKHEASLREQIARLSARLAAPGVDAETKAALEARRDAARSELARTRVARAQVSAEARFATIQLTVQTEASALVPAVPSRFDRGIDRAVEILVVEAMVVLYALVLVGPIALLALGAWLVRRGLRRRQEEQLLEAH